MIRSSEFKIFEEDEIVDVLRSQSVTHAKRMSHFRDGIKFPTGTVILTFDRPDLPQRVKLGFLLVKVDPYIPNPLRCFHCQRYGHTSDRCKQDKACSVCAEKGHDDRFCKTWLSVPTVKKTIRHPPRNVHCGDKREQFRKCK